jgi:hypothetical protein
MAMLCLLSILSELFKVSIVVTTASLYAPLTAHYAAMGYHQSAPIAVSFPLDE